MSSKNNKRFKYILSWFIYLVGFIGFVVFLSLAKNISTQAWLYAIGASFGTLLFSISGYLRE